MSDKKKIIWWVFGELFKVELIMTILIYLIIVAVAVIYKTVSKNVDLLVSFPLILIGMFAVIDGVDVLLRGRKAFGLLKKQELFYHTKFQLQNVTAEFVKKKNYYEGTEWFLGKCGDVFYIFHKGYVQSISDPEEHGKACAACEVKTVEGETFEMKYSMMHDEMMEPLRHWLKCLN